MRELLDVGFKDQTAAAFNKNLPSVKIKEEIRVSEVINTVNFYRVDFTTDQERDNRKLKEEKKSNLRPMMCQLASAW